MKKSFIFAFAIALLSLTAISPAFAIDLASAKKQGLVGEKADGLIAAISKTPTPEVQALVDTTNQGRMAVYQDMATKQGITVSQIKDIAANKILQKEEPGNYIQVNGAWSVKKAR